MKKIISFLCGWLYVYTLCAQQQPDTSYTVYSEYTKLVKDYPNLQIAQLVNTNKVSIQTNVEYAQVDERKLYLDVVSPTTKTNGIGIIMLHGGGWRSGHRSMMHPLAQQLAMLGYTCFTPEYRLSTEAKYPAAVLDVFKVVNWLRDNSKKYHLTKNVILGHSAGAQLATLVGAAVKFSTFDPSYKTPKLDAIVNIDGILSFTHPQSEEGDDTKKISAATQWLGGSKTEKPELWKQASPLEYASGCYTPVLFLNSKVARMHAGRDDFMMKLISKFQYTDKFTFDDAPHSFCLFTNWMKPTVQKIDSFLNNALIKKNFSSSRSITVNPNGKANFKTISQAIASVPLHNGIPTFIRVADGVYKEKILIDSTKDFIWLIGSRADKVIITNDDQTGKITTNGDTIKTNTSYTVKVLSNFFAAERITFQNTAGYTAGQAVVMESNGLRANFLTCRFIGNQDVLFLNNPKGEQAFKGCYIEGTTDFIFGSSTAWFENCTIHSKKKSHITAASTPEGNKYGFVFYNCKLTADTLLKGVSLGRPWRPHAAVAYINCYMGSHIKEEGWSNWNDTENYKTTRYVEYGNTGPGSLPQNRVPWSKQLSAKEASYYRNYHMFRYWIQY